MKKIKRILFLTLVIAMSAIMGIGTPLYAATDQLKQYIEDIVVVYGKDYTEAKAKLDAKSNKDGKAYYPVNDQCSFNQIDVNEEYEDSEECEYVLLGYSTTTNKDDAITDISTMYMFGNFNFDGDYDRILEEQKKQIHLTVEKMKPAFEIFAENVEESQDEGKDSLALVCYEILDKMYNDDIIDSNTAKPVTMAKMITNIDDYSDEQVDNAFLQMSALAFSTIQKFVFIGCMTNWVNDLSTIPANPNYTAQDHEKAEKLLSLMEDFQENMGEYRECGITLGDSEETIKTYLNNLSADSDKQKFIKYACAEACMNEVNVGGKTLLDLFMLDTNDRNTKEQLLPIAYCIDDDISCFLGVLDIADMFTVGSTAGGNVTEIRKTLKINEMDSTSVYAGVDRSIYNSNGIGVTNSASNEMNSSNTGLYDKYIEDKGKAKVLNEMAGAVLGITFVGGVGLLAFGGKAISAALSSTLVDATLDATMTVSEFFTCTVGGGAILCVLGIALLAVFSVFLAALIIANRKVNQEARKLRSIPRVMVDCVDAGNGKKKLTYYYCAVDTEGNLANINKSDNNEISAENQWCAFYYTKDAEAGYPLTADTVKVSNTRDNMLKTEEFMPVHQFGQTVAYNLNSFNGAENVPETFVGFSTDTTKKNAQTEKKLIATSVVNSTNILCLAGGIVLGIGLSIGISAIIAKKKKSNKAEA